MQHNVCQEMKKNLVYLVFLRLHSKKLGKMGEISSTKMYEEDCLH